MINYLTNLNQDSQMCVVVEVEAEVEEVCRGDASSQRAISSVSVSDAMSRGDPEMASAILDSFPNPFSKLFFDDRENKDSYMSF